MDSYYKDRNIKYFPKYYVGFSRGLYDRSVIKAFATPYELNKAGISRMETVDTWSKQNSWQKNFVAIPSVVIDNIPRNYSIGDITRRSNRTNNVVWNVMSEWGWEIKISSENFSFLIKEIGISKGGKIPVRCVFGRIGSQNHLIPEGTELWDKFILPKLNIEALNV